MLTTQAKALNLEQLTGKIEELSVLPHVVFKVLELSGNMDSPASEFDRAIGVDPGFSGKVLVLANSASFGLPRKVTSIKEAVTFLGFKNIRNIALTVGTYDLFVGKTDKESLRRRAWWRQSIDTAICAKYLASKMRLVQQDEAYTCGLLHLIGKTLIDRYAGGDYDLVTQMVDLGIPSHIAERDRYGYTHADVAAEATRKWGLPETLQYALQYLEPADKDHAAGNLRATLAVGAWLATHSKGTATEAPQWAVKQLGLSEEDLAAHCHACAEAISDTNLYI